MTIVTFERLVGRENELGAVDFALAELDRGEPAALALVGEPGIGKTRMLAELAKRADERGHLVLAGSASELETDVPFWVFVDALDEYVQALPPSSLAALADDDRARLAEVLPSLSGSVPHGEAASPQERYRIHRSVRDLLARLAAGRPLVLVLDDLHWADPASNDLVGALLHQPPAAPVLIALGARPHQAADRFSAALERGLRAGALVRMDLDALTLAETKELLGDGARADSAALLHRESGGNPFYLEQLARSLDRPAAGKAAAREVPLEALGVPRSVAEALSEELAGLSDNARTVLEGASVAGDPFEPELAAAAAGSGDPLAALDELLRLDLVRHTDVPRRFRFRHPLVRRAVYESTAGGWRLTAHERAAQALAEQGASAEARAHHVERSARTGDLDAAELLRTVGHDAIHRAPASAARWLGAALRLLPDAAPTAERVDLLLDRSSALIAIGRFEECHAVVLEAIDLVPEGPPALRVRVATACAAIERVLWRHDDAHARLARALDELEDAQSPEAVSLMIELALESRYRTDYDGMRKWSEEALRVARAMPNELLVAAATALLAAADAFAGATAEAEAHVMEAARLIDGMPDSSLASRIDVLSHLMTAELYLDRFREACAHGERAIAVARATGQVAHIPYLAPAVGSARMFRGQLVEAAEVLEDAIEATRLADDLQGLAWNLFNRSAAALAAGDLETALETAQESVDLTRKLGHSLIGVRAAVVWAAALAESGEPTRAIAALVDLYREEEFASLPGAWRMKRLELLTGCYLAVNRVDDATRAAADADTCAEAYGLRLPTAMALRAAAAVALHAGDLDGATERALASAANADEVGAPIEAALSRALAGRALAQAGLTDAAAAELERAIAALDACGAERYRDEATRELRKLGRRVHRRTRAGAADGSGVATLTERELELARLVVDRKTNPEIAAELFLSQKTVETHLRNIFRKVGVANRVELARAVEAAERAESAQTLT